MVSRAQSRAPQLAAGFPGPPTPPCSCLQKSLLPTLFYMLLPTILPMTCVLCTYLFPEDVATTCHSWVLRFCREEVKPWPWRLSCLYHLGSVHQALHDSVSIYEDSNVRSLGNVVDCHLAHPMDYRNGRHRLDERPLNLCCSWPEV